MYLFNEFTGMHHGFKYFLGLRNVTIRCLSKHTAVLHLSLSGIQKLIQFNHNVDLKDN